MYTSFSYSTTNARIELPGSGIYGCQGPFPILLSWSCQMGTQPWMKASRKPIGARNNSGSPTATVEILNRDICCKRPRALLGLYTSFLVSNHIWQKNDLRLMENIHKNHGKAALKVVSQFIEIFIRRTTKADHIYNELLSITLPWSLSSSLPF